MPSIAMVLYVLILLKKVSLLKIWRTITRATKLYGGIEMTCSDAFNYKTHEDLLW